MSHKIRDFILTNRVARRFMLLFNNMIMPTTLKLFIASVVLFIFLSAIMTYLYPQFSKNIYNKISYKFSQSIGLGSYNIYKINIAGNQHIKDSEIINLIEDILNNSNEAQNSQTVIQDMIDRIVTDIPWIVNIKINRNLPDILNIIVEEFQPVAIWHDNGTKLVIDKRGNTIEHRNRFNYNRMLQLSGNNANVHARSLFNLLTIDPSLSRKVYSATWVGNRRWDIRLENNIIIKLPEKNLAYAWKKLINIYLIQQQHKP